MCAASVVASTTHGDFCEPVFQLPRLQREHVKIKEAIESHGGNLQVAFEHAGPKPEVATVIGYFFVSDKFPSEMGFPLLNGDKHFVVEVGDQFWIDGNARALQWFERQVG